MESTIRAQRVSDNASEQCTGRILRDMVKDGLGLVGRFFLFRQRLQEVENESGITVQVKILAGVYPRYRRT